MKIITETSNIKHKVILTQTRKKQNYQKRGILSPGAANFFDRAFSAFPFGIENIERKVKPIQKIDKQQESFLNKTKAIPFINPFLLFSVVHLRLLLFLWGNTRSLAINLIQSNIHPLVKSRLKFFTPILIKLIVRSR